MKLTSLLYLYWSLTSFLMKCLFNFFFSKIFHWMSLFLSYWFKIIICVLWVNFFFKWWRSEVAFCLPSCQLSQSSDISRPQDSRCEMRTVLVPSTEHSEINRGKHTELGVKWALGAWHPLITAVANNPEGSLWNVHLARSEDLLISWWGQSRDRHCPTERSPGMTSCLCFTETCRYQHMKAGAWGGDSGLSQGWGCLCCWGILGGNGSLRHSLELGDS